MLVTTDWCLVLTQITAITLSYSFLSRQDMENSHDHQMRSISPASINSLQIALFSMKERCTRQQKRIDELESENSTLNTSRADLYNELKKLHEANVKLREKNVSLSHELHLKSKDLSETRETLERDRSRNNDNVKQLEKLQEDILRRNSVEVLDGEDCADNDMISSLPPQTVIGAKDGEMISLLDSGRSSISSIKSCLMTQQDQLKKALQTLKQKKSMSDQSAEELISAILSSTINTSQAQTGQPAKCCPMCEVLFSPDVSQAEFESHVMEHFSYEESETLRNFDTVPDALWPGIEHNPEL